MDILELGEGYGYPFTALLELANYGSVVKQDSLIYWMLKNGGEQKEKVGWQGRYKQWLYNDTSPNIFLVFSNLQFGMSWARSDVFYQ